MQTINKIDANIWTVEGSKVVFAGAAMGTRMTVVKLAGGELWVHSPVAWNSGIKAFIEQQGGAVAALIGPNKFHHLFLPRWREEFPQAEVFAEAQLKQKVASLADAHEITNQAPELYADEIDQVVFAGNRMFQEAVFFHRPSRTLILTDLLINLKDEHMNPLARLFLKFEGVTFPNGGVPRLYRWFTRDKNPGRAALQVLESWSPEHIVFSHGEAFDIPAAQVIKREFSFLK